MPPFDRSVTEAGAAQHLYDALLSLAPAQRRWCAYGTGAGYRLTFTDSMRTTLAATVEIGGCGQAVLHGTDRRTASDSFWAVFARTLGLDPRNEEQLFPQALPMTLPRTELRAPALRDRFAPRRL